MQILGFILLVLGLIVLGFGISSSQAVSEQVIEGVSGRYTSTTMWYILGGLTLILGGGALAYLNNN